jgi:hypothetical protein
MNEAYLRLRTVERLPAWRAASRPAASTGGPDDRGRSGEIGDHRELAGTLRGADRVGFESVLL